MSAKKSDSVINRNPAKGSYHTLQGAQTSSPTLYKKSSPHQSKSKVYLDANNSLPYQSGNSLLTPKAEFYKNLVEHYKKTLDSLNTGENQNSAVKNTIDFMNRQH